MTDHDSTTENATVESGTGDRSTGPTPPQPKLPLGVGAIIGQSFSILFRNFFKVLIIGLVPSIFGYLAPALVLQMFGLGTPETVQQFQQQPGNAIASITIAGILFALLQIAVFAFVAAVLAQLAYDAKLSRQVKLRKYLGPALSAVPAIVVLSIVISVLLVALFLPTAFLGAILGPFSIVVFLAMPVLYFWIFAVFSAMVPAIVIERIGFGGMGRSIRLTKEYRWPIVGTLILTSICYALLNLVIFAVFMLFVGTMSFIGSPEGMFSVIAGGLLTVILYALISTMGLGLIGIIIALIYARLREVKEGVSVDQIAAVFD